MKSALSEGRLSSPRLVVVKLGTSSLTGRDGAPDRNAVKRVTDQVAGLRERGTSVVIVTSGAIAAGLESLKLGRRPSDMPTLQAAAAVGQRRLMDIYAGLLERKGHTVAQVLLTQYDIVQRRHYLNARHTLDRLLELGCIPVVNENDTVAVEEIRYGDNDRLAALVANMARADLLALLSDVEGVFASNPRTGKDSSDAREGKVSRDAATGKGGKEPEQPLDTLTEITPDVLRSARGRSRLGSGGMSVKLEAARMASFSGVAAVIASAARPGVLLDIWAGKAVGTYFPPNRSPVQARKLWIAWAPASRGKILIDQGAVEALTERGKSLLAAGVKGVEGRFSAGDAVEVVNGQQKVVARGLVSYDAEDLERIAGTKGEREVIHRDQLVLM